MVPGAARAFRAHNERRIFGTDIPEECALDHAKAAPAFLENEQQVNFATGLISGTVWTGVKETSPHVYGDFPNTRTVRLERGWFAAGYGYYIYRPAMCPSYQENRDQRNRSGLQLMPP